MWPFKKKEELREYWFDYCGSIQCRTQDWEKIAELNVDYSKALQKVNALKIDVRESKEAYDALAEEFGVSSKDTAVVLRDCYESNDKDVYCWFCSCYYNSSRAGVCSPHIDCLKFKGPEIQVFNRIYVHAKTLNHDNRCPFYDER